MNQWCDAEEEEFPTNGVLVDYMTVYYRWFCLMPFYPGCSTGSKESSQVLLFHLCRFVRSIWPCHVTEPRPYQKNRPLWLNDRWPGRVVWMRRFGLKGDLLEDSIRNSRIATPTPDASTQQAPVQSNTANTPSLYRCNQFFSQTLVVPQ